MKWLFGALVAALLLARVPSLVQPMGGDQGIYAYVGQSILRGEVPYRDAWDQKPPGVHVVYAAMFGLWNNESIVPLADLVMAAVVAALLVVIGRRVTGAVGAGESAAVVFLLLSDPSFQRLGGLWVRGQAETFIAAAVSAAMVAAIAATRAGSERGDELEALAFSTIAGALLGLTFLLKYNAAAYGLPILLVYVLMVPDDQRRDRRNAGLSVLGRQLPALIVGFIVPVAIVGAWFAANDAVDDLFQATVVYNLRYSGETYAGAWNAVTFLLTFPVRHARVDALWFAGGLGCLALLVASIGERRFVLAPIWVATACLSIAVNGSRELPQYFVQAAPALALSAGVAGWLAWRALGPLARAALVILLAVAVVRVNQFDKWYETVKADADQARGVSSRADYLARFGGQRVTDKFSALATARLGDRLSTTTSTVDTVLVLGFSQNALVRSNRRSATRFFWSRPLLVGFDDGRPGYGAAGLLSEVSMRRPAEVVLQQRDWPAEGIDSATWFQKQPRLREWLAANYRQVADTGTFFIWRRLDLP